MQFSICMPVYNGEAFISHAIASVQAQTEADWELIIVDNASTDSTWDLIQREASKDQRIRVFRNQNNLGLAGNCNECLRRAQGEWLGFLPADDIYKPEVLARIRACGNDVLLWFHAHESVWENGRRDIIRAFPEERRFRLGTLAEVFYARGNVFGELSCVFAKRASAQELADGFRENRSTLDVDLWMRIALQNKSLFAVFSPEILSEASIHDASESSRYNRTGRNWVDFFAFLEAHSRHSWPFAIRLRQALRSAYCLLKHGGKLPRGEFRIAARTVVNLFISAFRFPDGATSP